jgi:hypothetical protein
LKIDKEDNFRRRDIPQLLNNWTAEVDRANSFFDDNPDLFNSGKHHPAA